MNESYDQFKTIMEENTNGHEVEIRFGESMTKELPAVRLFIYRHYPKPQYLTVVTYGLSLASHKDWSAAKPELMICVNSVDEFQWVGAVGVLADTARKEGLALEEGFPMLFNFPISPTSGMKALCVGAPADLAVNPIALSDRRIVIKRVYPVYSGETDIIADDGWQRFAERVGEDRLSDVKRPDLSSGAKADIQLSNEELLELLSSVVLDCVQELERKGLVHRSEYYDRGVHSNGNYEGMVRIVVDIALLLMNKVTKEKIVPRVTRPLATQGCSRELAGSVVDLVDLKLSPYADVVNLEEGHHDEKFFRLSWFQQTVAEFIASDRESQLSKAKENESLQTPTTQSIQDTANLRPLKRWWEIWK